MKKTYINPSMEIVKMKMNQQVLTSSDPVTGTKFNPGDTSNTMDGHSDDFDW